MTETQDLDQRKPAEEAKVRIVADHREANNHVFGYLRELGAEIAQEQLKTGDYVCSDRVAIERKTVADFLQSIVDQRIFRQATEIAECFEAPLMVIEGDPSDLFSARSMHPNAIRGALASIAIDHKMPIIWTRDAKETASQIYWIAYREQVKKSRIPAIRCPAKSKSLGDQQEFLVSGLPSINTKLSQALLRRFKTPRRVFSAAPERLMKVDGIGEKKAKMIWNLLNAEHEPRAEQR